MDHHFLNMVIRHSHTPVKNYKNIKSQLHCNIISKWLISTASVFQLKFIALRIYSWQVNNFAVTMELKDVSLWCFAQKICTWHSLIWIIWVGESRNNAPRFDNTQCNVVCGMTRYIIHRTCSFGTLTLGTTLYLQSFVRAPHTITASSNLWHWSNCKIG